MNQRIRKLLSKPRKTVKEIGIAVAGPKIKARWAELSHEEKLVRTEKMRAAALLVNKKK